jgi:hypothetical protein
VYIAYHSPTYYGTIAFITIYSTLDVYGNQDAINTHYLSDYRVRRSRHIDILRADFLYFVWDRDFDS